MSVTPQTTEKISSLISSAENITGENYDDLTEAVQGLVNGYGAGGSNHTHENKVVLDKLGEDENGLPTYDGNSLKGEKGSDGQDAPQPLIGTTETITPLQVKEAIEDGRAISLSMPIESIGATVLFNYWCFVEELNVVASSIVSLNGEDAYAYQMYGNLDEGVADWGVVAISIPAKTSQLENDSGFITEQELENATPVKGTDYFTESEIAEFTNTITENVNNNIGLLIDEINGEVI